MTQFMGGVLFVALLFCFLMGWGSVRIALVVFVVVGCCVFSSCGGELVLLFCSWCCL